MSAASWRLGLVAVLVAVAAFGAAAPTVPPPPADLQVRHLGLWPGAAVPQWNDGVPGQSRLQVEVFNNGTTPQAFRLDYWWVAGGARTPLNGAPESSFDLQREPVAAGTAAIRDFPWRLQPGQQGAGRVEVTATLASADGQPVDAADARPADNAGGMDVFVPTRSLAFDAEPQPAQVEPEATGFVRFTLRNAGNLPVDAVLRIARSPQDPRLNASLGAAAVRVPAAGNATIPLLVSYSPDGDFTPFAVSYDVEAMADGQVRKATSPQVVSADLAPPGSHNVSLQAAVAALPAHDGATSTVALHVANAGNRSEVVRMRAVGADGWDLGVEPPLLALRPAEAADAVLSVLPHGAPAGASATVHVEARSDAAPVAAADVRFQLAGAAPRIESVTLPRPPYVGQPFAVDVRLANPGDAAVPDGTQVRLRVLAAGAPAALVTQAAPRLAAGEGATLQLAAPAPVQGGSVTLQTSWDVPGAPVDAVTTTAFAHAVALRVTAPAALQGSPGETVAYRNGTQAFRVENLGNAAETVALRARTDAGSAAVEGPSVVVLPANASWLVAVRHTLPDPAGNATTSDVRLEATVGATVASSTVSTRIRDQAPPELRPDVAPRTWPVGVRPLPLAVKVTDHGAVVRVNATVTGPGGSRLVTLDPSSGSHRGEVALPTPGNYTVSYAAADAAGNRAVSPAQAVLAVERSAPVLRFDGLPQSGPLPAGTVAFAVTSPVPLSVVRTQAEQDGKVSQKSIQVAGATGETTGSIDLSGFRPGQVRVTLSAEDAAGGVSTLVANVTVAPAAWTGTGSGQAVHGAPWPSGGALLALAGSAWRRRGSRADAP